MANVEKSLVLSLAEGVTETVVEETANGIITRSENTRLGVRKGTVTRAPAETLIADLDAGTVCGGFAVGPRRSTVGYFRPPVGHKHIRGTEIEDLVSPVTGNAGQSAYVPYPVTAAGNIAGGLAVCTPATAYDSEGRQWFVSIRRVAAALAPSLVVSVVDAGEEVVTQRVVASPTTSLPNYPILWCAVVPKTGGMVAFYGDDTGVHALSLSIDTDGLTLIVGTAALLYAPLKPDFYVRADVVSNGTDAAWLLTRDASTNTTSRLSKVNLSALTVPANLALASTVTSTALPVHYALSLVSISGTPYLAFAISETSVKGTYGVIDPVAMSLTWSATAAEYGQVAVQPYVDASRSVFVFAAESVTNNMLAAPTKVTFRARAIANGAGADDRVVNWYALQSRGAAHVLGDEDVAAYFSLLPWWTGQTGFNFPSKRGDLPTDAIIDPSVEIFTPYWIPAGSGFVMTPVAHVGVDRAASPILPVHTSNSLSVSLSGRLGLAYLEIRTDQSYAGQSGFGARFVELDLLPSQQPGTAYGQSTLVAGALTAAWDGAETMEAGFLRIPRVLVELTGGTGADLSGSFLVTAVITVRDAQGNIRRSAPAQPYPVTLAGTKPKVHVTVPESFRNGVTQGVYNVVLYWTLDSETRFYAHQAVPSAFGTNGLVSFTNIAAPNAYDVPLYSAGTAAEELLPACPPPSRDVCSVGGRLWLVDAEEPYAVWPSKLRIDGYVPEFAAELKVTAFDRQFGELLACVDIGGSPHFLAERGIWRVDGEGPNDAGPGGAFSEPRLVLNIGCKGRHTVAQVPGVGVMFQCQDGKFALFGGGSVKRFENFGPYEVAAPTVHLAQCDLIYPLSSGDGYIVYNWLLDAWTTWPLTSTIVYAAVGTVQFPDYNRTLLYAPSTGWILTFTSDDVAPQDKPIVVERGWIAPEGPQTDCTIREVWVHARRAGPHGLTVRVSCDYDDTKYVERTWLSSNVSVTDPGLAQLADDGRYTIAVNVHAMRARAVKVRCTEVAPFGPGFEPLSLTITYGADGGVQRRKLKEGALK